MNWRFCQVVCPDMTSESTGNEANRRSTNSGPGGHVLGCSLDIECERALLGGTTGRRRASVSEPGPGHYYRRLRAALRPGTEDGLPLQHNRTRGAQCTTWCTTTRTKRFQSSLQYLIHIIAYFPLAETPYFFPERTSREHCLRPKDTPIDEHSSASAVSGSR
jgi:hypothetical protein